MFTRFGYFVVRHRKAVLVGTFLFVLAAGAVGGGVTDKLTTGGFTDPGAESTRAKDLLERKFASSDPNVVLLVTARRGTVDDVAVAATGRALTEELAAEPGVASAISYWSLGGAAPLRSESARRALVLAAIDGSEDHISDVIKRLSPHYTRHDAQVRVAVGGQAEVFRQVDEQISQDLVTAETIALPITLLLLVLVFGGLVAAGLPLLVGILAIMGAFLALFVTASITDVSIYSLNLTTAMGLGLAIDYSLFIVSRYREEMHAGLTPHEAVVRAVATAGRTVAGSALTVALALSALLIFPLVFLRSFAYAGIAVSLIAAVGAVVFLPALLAVLGHRVDALRLWKREPKPVGEGIWHRIAVFVMRRPVPIAAGVILLLLALGLPFLRLAVSIPDDRVLPTDLSSRQVQDAIRAEFTTNEAGAVEVVAPDAPTGVAEDAAIDRYATRLSLLRGAARVDALTGSYIAGANVPVPDELTARFRGAAGTWLSVVPSVEPLSNAGERLAKAVRDAPSPVGEVLVGGRSAELADGKAALFGRMPWAGLWIAITSFVLLFLMFGSAIVPIKALLLNVLSLTATFGAMVWIFQDGHLAGFLGFTPTGTLAASMPILMFCVAFGLSMDYEVFLLSRIKEEHDRTGDNEQSVAVGLEQSGRIVTASAVLISVVFLAFATSGVAFIKLFGIGLALAVLMDAFVIRATLVPAFMKLAGELNWWAPPWMRRIYDRFGISESEAPDRDEPPAGPARTTGRAAQA